MTTICRNIESDLRKMLGEINLPPRITRLMTYCYKNAFGSIPQTIYL